MIDLFFVEYLEANDQIIILHKKKYMQSSSRKDVFMTYHINATIFIWISEEKIFQALKSSSQICLDCKVIDRFISHLLHNLGR